MSNSETIKDFYQENSKLLKEYIDTRLELLRLNSIKTISRTMSMLILVSLISFMILFFLLFLVISFSWMMAEVTGSNTLGFLYGGGVFLMIILIAIIFRKPLFLNPLIRLFIRTSSHEDEEEEY